jgi:hypothetical protein
VKEHEALFKQGIIKKPTPPSHRELEKLIHEKLIKQTVASWNKAVMENFQTNPFTEQELEKVSEKYRKRFEKDEHVSKAYGTSLIAAAITPWYWFAYHVGDGRFSVLYQNGKGDQPVPWDPKCFLNVTTSICDEDILDRELGVRTYLSMKADKEPPVAFFLCSDGIDDNYPADEKENARQLYKLYREIAVTFAEDGYESTCGKDGISGQIKDLVNGFATKGKGDDTSLAGIVNIEELKKAAPIWKENMAAADAKRAEAARIAEEAKAEEEAAARRAERAAVRAKAEEKAEAERTKAAANAKEKAGDGENIEAYDEFSSNAGQPPVKSEDKKKVEENETKSDAGDTKSAVTQKALETINQKNKQIESPKIDISV